MLLGLLERAFNPEVLTEAVRRCYDNSLLTSGVDESTHQLASENPDEKNSTFYIFYSHTFFILQTINQYLIINCLLEVICITNLKCL